MSIRSKINLTIPEKIKSIYNGDAISSLRIDKITNADDSGDGIAEIIINDTIGWGWEEDDPNTVDGIAKFLSDNRGKAVRVLINSFGGFAFDGIAMANLLSGHDGHVTTRNIGMAGSAASIILMSGDTVEMHDNATLFIHRAIGLAIGNVDAMLELAEFLDQIDQSIANVYAGRTGKTQRQILKMMAGDGKKDGTSMSAETAKENGFIDKIIKSKSKTDDNKANKNERPKNVQARLRRLVADEKEAIAFLQ